MRSRDVAYVVHVEAEQRPHLRLFQQLLDARKTLGAQPLKIYPFFPVYAHQTIGSDRHDFSPLYSTTQCFSYLDDRGGGRYSQVFQHRREWHRHIHPAQAFARGIPVVKDPPSYHSRPFAHPPASSSAPI